MKTFKGSAISFPVDGGFSTEEKGEDTMSLGITEITLILAVMLLLFGGKRIPELARAFGRASYEFRKAKDVIKKETDELKESIEDVVEQPVEYQVKGVVNR